MLKTEFTVKKFVFILLVVMAGLLSVDGKPSIDNQEITEGATFISPDGKFTLQYVLDEDDKLKITDNVTGQAAEPIILESGPPHIVRWTGDSKTIVVVVHIAGGSQVELIHLKDGKWIESAVLPPTKHSPIKYSVIKVMIATKLVRLTYEVINQSASGAYQNAYQCTFDVNPDTGTISNKLKSVGK